MTEARNAGFIGLINLADEALGARTLAASDEFFAEKENLLRPGRGRFDPDAYTERGKWMDGWESRRKRTPGHDWCIVELGEPGVVRILDIDTNHFLGNHPPYASVEACRGDRGAPADALAGAAWTEILPASPLRPGSQNLFAVAQPGTFTHLRLNIHPDGGVARFRAYGDVEPDWGASRLDDFDSELTAEGEVDLVSVRSGGLALACSDMFFGPMNNLILPGRAANMGGGWETRRSRPPGSDWIILRLGAAGTVGLIEVDTNYFKGNYPDQCSVEGIHAPGASILELVDQGAAWHECLPRVKLQGHTRQFFREQIATRGPFTHVRLSIFPDGGVSRLRIFGRRAEAQ